VYATAIIVFREALEAALIIGIALASAKGLPHRGRWVTLGMVAGVSGAVLVAAFAGSIAELAAGAGQELFNAIVLVAAVLMLGWHNIWMRRHGRAMVSEFKRIGEELAAGERHVRVLALVVGLAVVREGAEVVLFLYGIAAANDAGAASMLSGGAIGLAGGVLVGTAMYLGLLRIPTGRLFSVTGWLLLLLAAGMAAQASGYLVQAGLLPALGHQVWNTSGVLSEHSIVGQVLHVLVGYVARPDGVQVLTYVATALIIGTLMLTIGSRTGGVAVRTAVVLLAGAAALTLVPRPAAASHKVYSPIVEGGEFELEARGHVLSDGEKEADGARKDKYEIGYGFTDNWFSSLVFEYEKEGDDDYKRTATSWENIFQLTEQGKYWVDTGLYVEYEVPANGNEPDKIETKLLLEKSLSSVVHTANLVFEREIGGGADDQVDISYAWRSKWRLDPRFEPALELYGELGSLDSLSMSSDQTHVAGPVVSGAVRTGPKSALAYELGYLFALTDQSPDGVFKWLVEYERYF
jgi:high-affinity iron transporter